MFDKLESKYKEGDWKKKERNKGLLMFRDHDSHAIINRDFDPVEKQKIKKGEPTTCRN